MLAGRSNTTRIEKGQIHMEVFYNHSQSCLGKSMGLEAVLHWSEETGGSESV